MAIPRKVRLGSGRLTEGRVGYARLPFGRVVRHGRGLREKGGLTYVQGEGDRSVQ